LERLFEQREASDEYHIAVQLGEYEMTNQKNLLPGKRHCEGGTEPVIRKERSDLTVLRYMARRLHLMIQGFEQAEACSQQQPQLYLGQERRGHAHRIIIYRQQELLLKSSFTFVGFISRRKDNLAASTIAKIQKTDQKMIRELVSVPGILSYSSLELPHGNWCNLVLMSNMGVKSHFKKAETHLYAAHQLAHTYYDWIRLQIGTLPEGLDPMEMRLLKTRYYTFYLDQQKPHIQELTYGKNHVIRKMQNIVPVTQYLSGGNRLIQESRCL
jgi:hypothetical protein